MTKKAILPKLLVAVLLFGVIACLGCEGAPDRSLAIQAYAPVNQQAGQATPMMSQVFKVRLGVFQEGDEGYRNNAIYKFDDIVKEYINCSSTYSRAENGWSETDCVRCVEGSCSSESSVSAELLDLISSCQNEYLEQISAGTIGYADCSETEVIDNTRVGTLDLPDLPASAVDPYVYVIEGFGNPTVESTDCCGNCEGVQKGCDEGWDCRANADNLNVCVRTMQNAPVARGVSAPTVYNGDDAQTADVMLALSMEFATVTSPDGAASLMGIPRYGHKALELPDGKVLVVGGENVTGSRAPTFPSGGELYDPADQSFTDVEISNWTGGRSFFTLNEIENTSDAVIDEEPDDATAVPDGKFLLVGGNTSQGPSSEIYIGTYNSEEATVTMKKLSVANFTPVAFHATTPLGDNLFLITGGLYGQNPTMEAWLLDANTETLTKVGSMTKARYKHTATAMPNGKVIIVGGFDTSQFTTSRVEVYDAETRTFSEYVYNEEENETDYSAITSRVGHIAVPLIKYLPDGSVSDPDSARVAIYGGYRWERDDESAGSRQYWNIPDGVEVIVAFIDSNGRVYQTNEIMNSGYYNAMNRVFPPSPHPCVDSEWVWLGDSNDTILVLGGRRNNQTEYSDWAEIIRFTGSDAGYSLGSFSFGPSGEDRVETPFRVARFAASGRLGMSLTQLSSGMYLVTGGLAFQSGQSETQTLSSAEIFVPPSYNRWGNVFKVSSDF